MSLHPDISVKRIAIGIGLVLAIGAIGDLVLPPNNAVSRAITQSGLGLMLAMAIGGYVARKGFLIPALILAILGWSSAIYFGWRIGQLAQPPVTIDEMIRNNMVLLAVTIVAAALGATIGMKMAASRLRAPHVDAE